MSPLTNNKPSLLYISGFPFILSNPRGMGFFGLEEECYVQHQPAVYFAESGLTHPPQTKSLLDCHVNVF